MSLSSRAQSFRCPDPADHITGIFLHLLLYVPTPVPINLLLFLLPAWTCSCIISSCYNVDISLWRWTPQCQRMKMKEPSSTLFLTGHLPQVPPGRAMTVCWMETRTRPIYNRRKVLRPHHFPLVHFSVSFILNEFTTYSKRQTKIWKFDKYLRYFKQIPTL